MEYSLTINQLVLTSWKGQIDLTDAFIVAFVGKVEASRSDKIEQKKAYRGDGAYVWISHEWLLEQNPLIDISLVTLRRRLKNLVSVGLLDRFTDCEEDTKRYRAYYRLSNHYHNIEQHWKDQLDEIHAGRKTVQDVQQSLPLVEDLISPNTEIIELRERDNQGRFIPVVKNDHGPTVKNDHGAVVKNDHISFNDLPLNDKPLNEISRPTVSARVSKKSSKPLLDEKYLYLMVKPFGFTVETVENLLEIEGGSSNNLHEAAAWWKNEYYEKGKDGDAFPLIHGALEKDWDFKEQPYREWGQAQAGY